MKWALFYYDEAISDIRDAKKWYYIDQPAKRLVIIAIVHQHRRPELAKGRK